MFMLPSGMNSATSATMGAEIGRMQVARAKQIYVANICVMLILILVQSSTFICLSKRLV